VMSKYADMPKTPEAPVIDISDDSDSSDTESDDDGIQVVEKVAKPAKEPLATVTLDDSDSDSDEVVIDSETNKFKSRPKPDHPIDQIFDRLKTQPSASPKTTTPKATVENPIVIAKSSPKESPRSGKVSVSFENSKGRKSLSRKCSSSSSSSSSSEDDEASPGLSLNVTGCVTPTTPNSKGETSFEQTLASAKAAADSAVSPLRIEGWTDEMHEFYDKVSPEELQNQTLEQILSTMPDDPQLWKVSAQDRYSFLNRSPGGGRGRGRGGRGGGRYFGRGGPMCHNCNRQGHGAADCTERVRPVACYMCGEEGHMKEGCPKGKCLNCGAKAPDAGDYPTSCGQCRRLREADCFNCGGRGHTRTTCPDNWRRWHATLSGDKVVVPDKETLLMERPTAWCCNCAGQGHYVHQCPRYSRSPYAPTVPYVVTYQEPTGPESLEVSEGGETPSTSGGRKRKLRAEIKAKRKEFLRGSIPGLLVRNPHNRRRRFENEGSEDDFSPVSESSRARLEKAKATLEELLADQAESEAASMSSSKKWRRQKRKVSKVIKAMDDHQEEQPHFKNRNSKKKNKAKGHLGSQQQPQQPQVHPPGGGQRHKGRQGGGQFRGQPAFEQPFPRGNARRKEKQEKFIAAKKKKVKAAKAKQQSGGKTKKQQQWTF